MDAVKDESGELSLPNKYELYLRYRADGESALAALKLIRELEAEGAIPAMVRRIISIVLGLLMLPRLFKKRRYAGGGMLWIKSPSGKAIHQFPFYQALRIVRRREALHILLVGDKAKAELKRLKDKSPKGGCIE